MITHEQILGIKARGDKWAENYDDKLRKHIASLGYEKGVYDQMQLSYPKQDVDDLLEAIRRHAFNHEMVLDAINEFTSKHNPDETNNIER